MNVKGSDGIHANLSSTFRRKLCVLNTNIENKTKIATIFRFRRFRRFRAQLSESRILSFHSELVEKKKEKADVVLRVRLSLVYLSK